MRCDVCVDAVPSGTGERVTPEIFNFLLDNGFGLDETNIKMLTETGMSRSVAETTLKEQYRLSKSDWLLCPNCAAKAFSTIENRTEKWMSPDYIAVTSTAGDVGMGFGVIGAQVALSRAVWEECVEWTDEDSERQTYQEQDARLWDVLFTAGGTLQIKINQFFRDQVHKFSVICVPRDGNSINGVNFTLLIRPADIRGQQWLVLEKDDQISN